jgi:hypothetical protein
MLTFVFAGTLTTINCSQGALAYRAVSGVPIVNACTRKSKGFDNYFWTLTILYTLIRANANLFHCLATYLFSICCFHGNENSIMEEKISNDLLT